MNMISSPVHAPGTSILGKTRCQVYMTASTFMAAHDDGWVHDNGWVSGISAKEEKEMVFCLQFLGQKMDMDTTRTGFFSVLFKPNSTATGDVSNLSMTVALSSDFSLADAHVVVVAAITFGKSGLAAMVRSNVPQFDEKIRGAVLMAAGIVSKERPGGSFVLLVPLELLPVFNWEGQDKAALIDYAVKEITAKARSSASAVTNISILDSPSLAGNVCIPRDDQHFSISSGSAWLRWLQKLGGSRPALLPLVVGPSQRQPVLGRSSSTELAEAFICHTSTSFSEIPLGENAAPDATASVELPPKPPAPPATATSVAKSTNHKNALKVLLVIVAATFSIIEFIKDINSTWKTEWKVLYSTLVMLSLVSTVAGLFAALSPVGSWGRTLFAFCVRFGLLLATALFIIVITCQLGTFGCVAGIPAAALVMLLLAVVWLKSSAKRARRVEPAPEEGAVP